MENEIQDATLLSLFQQNDLFREIEIADELDRALELLKQADVIGAILEKSRQFEEYSIAYARLHAEAIAKVVELGGEDKLPRGYTKKAAIWLAKMAGWERTLTLEMLNEGFSIEQIYKREVADKEKLQRATNKLDRLREKVLDEVEHVGVVDLDGYKEEVFAIVDDFNLRNDVVEGTRIALRKAGAVGVEPRSDLYVMPTEDNEYYVQRAIVTRIKSVCNDILKIKSLVERCGVKVPYSDAYCSIQELWDNKLGYFDRGMKGTAYAAINGGQVYTVYLMMMFSEIGLFSDDEDFYADYLIASSEKLRDAFRSSYSPKSHTFQRLLEMAREMRKKEDGEND